MRPSIVRLTMSMFIGVIWLLPITALAADRDKLLTEPGVFGTYAAYQIDQTWWALDKAARGAATAAVREVLQRHSEQAAIDVYLLRGLSDHADILIRLHSMELATNQQILLDLLATPLGMHLTPSYTFHGLTKKANYMPAFSEEMKTALKTTVEPGAKRYAIVIPIRKDAAWWQLDKDARTAMMKEHTDVTLAYLKTVKRKLYHSSGLDDFDFLTYFETSTLSDFHNLVLNLEQVKENQHNRRFGSPTLLGTLHPLDELLNLLSR